MKIMKVDWSFAFQRSFGQHISLVFSRPTLNVPDFSIHSSIAVETSDYGMVALLLKADKDKVQHAVVYFSKNSPFIRKNILQWKKKKH